METVQRGSGSSSIARSMIRPSTSWPGKMADCYIFNHRNWDNRSSCHERATTIFDDDHREIGQANTPLYSPCPISNVDCTGNNNKNGVADYMQADLSYICQAGYFRFIAIRTNPKISRHLWSYSLDLYMPRKYTWVGRKLMWLHYGPLIRRIGSEDIPRSEQAS